MRINHLRQLTICQLLLALETILMLAVARGAVLCCSTTRLHGWLLRLQGAPVVTEPARAQQVLRIGGYVRRISTYTPWRSLCLEQAIAAKLMLWRRGVASTLHLGVAKQGETLTAHAWLDCNGKTITGGQGKAYFTPLTVLGQPTV